MGRNKKNYASGNKRDNAEFVERVSKIYGKNRLLRGIGKRIISKELTTATNYFFREKQVTAEEVAGGALGFGLTVSVLTLLVGVMFNLLLALMLSMAMFVLACNYVITYFPKKYNKHRWIISKYADLILGELLFMLFSTGSIFDFILLVGNADYPIISHEFKILANRVNSGENPEKLLVDFARNQPTDTLKIYIPTILKYSKISDDLVDKIVRIAQREARNEYKRYTLELESRLLIAIGIGFFTPIILSLGLLMSGVSTSPLFLSLVPLQIIILVILDKFVTQSKAELLETTKPEQVYKDLREKSTINDYV